MSTFTTGTTQQGIWDYVEKGQTALVIETLKRDPAQLLYKQGHNEDTVLHVIAASGNTDMLKAVIAVIHPAALDIRNRNGGTALMAAGVNGREDNADTLMEAGAKVNAVSNLGDTLLSKTVKGMNQDDVQEHEKPPFRRIMETAIDKFGAKVDDKAIGIAETFEDDKTLGFLEQKRAAQKAAPTTAAPAALKAATVSKPG